MIARSAQLIESVVRVSSCSACNLVTNESVRWKGCRERRLACYYFFHAIGQRRSDGATHWGHLVHHIGEGDAAIYVDYHRGTARAAPQHTRLSSSARP